MARPDGRAFLRPLGAGPPRGGALRGASALAPGLGLAAASVWARPCGRASRPGPRPALPTRRPRGLVLLTARQGDASPAGWWGLPSAPSGRVPPAPSGQRAATPAHPGRLGRRPPRPPAAVGVMCGPRPRPCVARPGQVGPQPLLGGTPPRRKAKPPAGAASRALPRSSPSPVAASVLRRGPAPTLWGLWGRPRLRPGRARLRPAAPRWPACGSACAGAALPPLGPPGVAAPPRCGVPPPSRGAASAPLRGASRARPQFRRRALGPCPLCGSRPLSAPRAAGARGCAACGRESHTGAHLARPRQAACGGPCLMISGAAKGDKVTRPAVAGPPAPQPTDDKMHKQ